ncbi:MAG: ATP-binding protein [Oscillospiraceae bacterium]|nr:ATP-binding protein [Oscillospiraceae bacterium]
MNNEKGSVVLICGKLCSGKSTYAQKLRQETNAVILSVDEITLSLFNGDLGDKHDEMTEKVKKYLLEKSMQILEAGADVILEWGFWTKQSRINTRSFYESRNISCQLHYVDITDDIWQQNISERNRKVLEGTVSAYYADDGLIEKFKGIFEMPDDDEINVRYQYC